MIQGREVINTHAEKEIYNGIYMLPKMFHLPEGKEVVR